MAFWKKKKDTKIETPKVMGLGIGHSFEVDSLLLRIIEDKLIIEKASPTQIIQAVGVVDWDGTKIYRLYTDDEAFLQVVTEGGNTAENVVDVKLFHYYDTLDIGGDTLWNELLDSKIGNPTYPLEGHTYSRIWTSESDYHRPVHMKELTYDENGETSETDQFTMLFERDIGDGDTETLFLSAEEVVNDNNLERCLVISTGITLSPSQITIHG